jgi:hypothetical protein
MKGRNDDSWRSVMGDSDGKFPERKAGVVTSSIPRPAADKSGTSPFRSDCGSRNSSIIVTKKRSTWIGGIQGVVCVDGLVLGSCEFHFWERT